MNKRLVKELTREVEELKKNSVSLKFHETEMNKMKKDKQHLVQQVRVLNQALEDSCSELAKYVSSDCSPDTFIANVKAGGK